MKTYDDEFQYKLKWEEDLAELEIKYRDRLLEPRLGDNPFNLERKKEMIEKE